MAAIFITSCRTRNEPPVIETTEPPSTATEEGSGERDETPFETPTGPAAFSQCENLKTVVLNEGLRKIGELAFSLCNRIEEVEIPESVTEIGGQAFRGCGKLTAVTIKGDLTEIPYCAFQLCESLETVSIPGSVTKLWKWGAFRTVLL
ncbi:MAG: leucine-rich repeat domain-containing protein [Clostridia bacterium]|nr:leucine-rich repeat domain-containing protein [Clostridia bacterium]